MIGELKGSDKLMSKVKSIVVIVLSLIVILLSIIGILDVLPIESIIRIEIPMLGIITLINGLATYKTNKTEGRVIIICAFFIFSCCLFAFFA